MESLLETIDLDMEETSELLFKVRVEGIDSSPAKVRLVCEAGDMAYMFTGRPINADGTVQFVIPTLKDRIKEGSYLSRVEVLVENRYFTPVQFNLKFKKAISVVAESIQVVKTRPQEVTVTVEPVVKKMPVVVETKVIEKPIERPPVRTQRTAPPPARVKAASTLRERYAARTHTPDDVDERSKDLIKQLAQTIAQTRRDQR